MIHEAEHDNTNNNREKPSGQSLGSILIEKSASRVSATLLIAKRTKKRDQVQHLSNKISIYIWAPL
jgi:hypothetical protein